MRIKAIGAILAAALTLAACGDEDPVGIDALVPEDLIRTFEVVLDASRFLTFDTTAGDFLDLDDVDYLVAAEDFEGVLDVHSLMRFRIPRTFSVTGSSGSTTTDSAAVPFAGEIFVRIDSLRSVLTGPVRLALYRTAEAWDPGSATWELRVDSGGVSETWLVPGGTPGELVDSVTIAPGDTAATFQVDSATIAEWADTTNAARGMILLSETPGARVQLDSIAFRVTARPSLGTDTITSGTAALTEATIVMTPLPTAGSDRLLVGGAQAWRTYFGIRQRLDTVTVEVPGAPPGTTVTLGEATLNFAALVLEPVAAPGGFVLSDTLRIVPVAVFGADDLPIVRAPLGSEIGLSIPVTAEQLAAPDGAIEVNLSSVIRNLTVPRTEESTDTTVTAATFALLATPEGANFGIAAFGAAESAAAPKLRLVLSVTREARF